MLSDKHLCRTIRSALRSSEHLSSHPIAVKVSDGRVTLDGTVQSHRRKLTAHEIVMRIEGVNAVVNNLRVTVSEAEDHDIARNVRALLKANVNVTKETVHVTVTSGTITLAGTVGSVQERSVAEDLARSVRGVHDVTNLLLVDLEKKVGDEELANSIKAALERTDGIPTENMGVTVAGPSVTVYGEIQQPWQKGIVEMVLRGFGLLRVHNELEFST